MRLTSPSAGMRCGQQVQVVAPATLGRAPDADVVLADPTVSRQHARLTVDEGRVHLTVLAAGNGTFVDGIRLEPGARAVLRPGQRVQLGGLLLEFNEGTRTQPVFWPLTLPTLVAEIPGTEPTPLVTDVEPLLVAVLTAGEPQIYFAERLLDLVPSAARVLFALMRAPNQLVSEDALQAVATADANVQQLVSLARRALRDVVSGQPALEAWLRARVAQASAAGRFAELASLETAELMRRVIVSRRNQGYVLCLPPASVRVGSPNDAG